MTKPQIAHRLRNLSAEMLEIAVEIDYYGGLAEWAVHSKELLGASKIAAQWADEILNEDNE